MSSMTLFNKNYATQNLKKSKGILAIMLIIIPIITLFVLYNYDNTSYVNPYEMAYLIIPNLIGMFIIPFIVSNVLLGYVYKRNSIDFINAMPITRKKIYLTNIITGILYLILLQIINFIMIATYVLIVQNTFISMQMVVDSLVIMTIAYCFMFVLSSLALTVSGNRFTQIVIVMLILFLIPFIRMINLGIVFSTEAKIINNNGIENVVGIRQDKLFSLPINICYSFAIEKSVYDVSSIVYTLILGFIYTCIGTKLFEKRKMEDTGYSFASSKVHLFVKALTLYPMVTFVKYIYGISRIAEVILVVFLIFVYYFIYDLITNKKVKLKTTIISFICFFVILFGVIKGIDFINQKFLSKPQNINVSEVKELTLQLDSFSYSYDDNIKAVVKNQEIVNYILDNITDSESSEYRFVIRIGLKLKNNKKVQIPISLKEKTYIELLEKIYNDEKYIKDLSEEYKIENEAVINLSNREVNINLRNEKEIKKLINENVEEAIKTKIKYLIDYTTIYKNSDQKYVSRKYYSRNFLSVYLYKNHGERYFRLELDNLPELEKVVAKKVNEKTKDQILKKTKLIDETHSTNFSVEKYMTDGTDAQTHIWLTKDDYKKVLDFLVANYDKEFDPKKDYYEIRNYDFDLVFYTNDIEGFNEVAPKDMEFTKDNEINEIYYTKGESAEVYVDDTVNNF